jgi:hypothetical protein
MAAVASKATAVTRLSATMRTTTLPGVNPIAFKTAIE